MMEMSKTEDYITIKEAAELRDIKPVTLYQWCYDGKIQTRRSGEGARAGYLLKLVDLDRFLKAPRGRGTVISMQVEDGVQSPPLRPAAITTSSKSEDDPNVAGVNATPSNPSKTQIARKRKTAVLSSKDHMRHLSILEMIDVSGWLLHRIGTRLGSGGN